MAVTLVDRRTTVTDAETVTDWTGVGYGTISTDVAEATNAVAESLASTTGQTYYTQPAGTVNLGTSPGTLVYVYSFNNALQDAWDASPPPQALMLGDGTDRIAFHMAGANRRVFNHLEGPTGWQNLVLDTGQASAMNSAGNTYVVNGTFAGLDFANITQWGCSFDTNSKALGGGYNVAVDIIRHGNDGIYVLGGTTGDRGTFSEVAVADRSTADGAAHGLLRAYTTIAFGCQGPLTFGRDDVATNSWFEVDSIVLVFEDRNIGNDKYYLNQRGHASADNYFILTNSTVATAGPHVGMDFTGGDINEHTSTGNTFSNLGDRPIVYPTTAESAANFTVSGNTYVNCGKITLNDTDFTNCTIQNPAPTTDYALVYGGSIATGLTISGYEGTAGTAAIQSNVNIDMNGELDRLTATKGTNATHVIELGANTPTSITLTDWTVSGYNSSNGQNDSVIYNNSNKAITVNVAGNTGTISYRNGGTSTTTIQSSADYTLTNIANATEVTILDNDVSLLNITGTPSDQNIGDVSGNTEVGQSFQVSTAGNADRIRANFRKVGSPTDQLRMRMVSGVPGTRGYVEFTSTSATDVDYIESTKPLKLASSSGDLVVICNTEFDTFATNHYMLSNSGAASTGPMLSVYETGGSSLGFLVYDGSGTSTNFSVSHSLTTATRYWLKFEYDHSAGQGSMWFSTDDVLTDPLSVTWTQISTTQSGTARQVVDRDETFYIGSNKDLGVWYDGKIAYLGVWRGSTIPASGVKASELDFRLLRFDNEYQRDGTGRFDWIFKTENTTKPTMTVGVFDDVAVATGTELTTSYAEFDVQMNLKQALSLATTYGVEFYRTGGLDASNYYQIEYSTADVHASGSRYLGS